MDENSNLCGSGTCKKKNNIVILIVASTGGFFIILLIVAAILWGLRRRKKQEDKTQGKKFKYKMNLHVKHREHCYKKLK